MRSPDEVKKDIPFLERYGYWECTAVGPPLRCVIDGMVEHAERFPFNYLVGDCKPAQEANRHVTHAVERVARLINAEPDEVSLYPKNTTEALGMVLEGYPWREGDEVIGSDVDHLSCNIPLLRLQKRRGVRLILLKADPRGMLDPETIKASITPRTRLITICHASNLFGSIQPAREICRIARERDVLTLVDAAQTVGRTDVDVKHLGCDFLTICGRKHLCGPQGTAALFVRKEWVNKLEPILLGGISNFVTSELAYDFHPGPRRFNAGILNTAGVVGLGAAVEYWSRIGIEKIREYTARLTERLQGGLRDLGAVLYGPVETQHQVGIVSFRFNDLHPDALATRLEKEARIIIRSGQPGSPVFHSLGVDKINRLSAHYYHSEGEVERLLATIGGFRHRPPGWTGGPY